ncbi:hypothetical protein [Granulicella sp. L60]|uniref:hypothetical protein n=1 Tax=Granulicella sp. L60 TaxID=1641866 RepID=UPI00131DE829|nr:hypothetical protein [Granulicella sp. L60]
MSKPQDNLSGMWQTGSGAVYEIWQKGINVLALYSEPSQGQVESGVRSGDIAFVGTVIGQIATVQFHHRAPLTQRTTCPATWYFVDTLYLTISSDGNQMDGDLIDEHVSDECRVDDRRLDHLTFVRTREA